MNTILNLQGTNYITQFFRWNLLPNNNDDNKFVDCSIASNSKFIVTNDNHFNVLKRIDFPKVNIINYDEFKTLFNMNDIE